MSVNRPKLEKRTIYFKESCVVQTTLAVRSSMILSESRSSTLFQQVCGHLAEEKNEHMPCKFDKAGHNAGHAPRLT